MSETAKQGGLRVVKLGGSLLDWTQWPICFRTWLKKQPGCKNLLVVGGGDFAEAIRKLDQIHQFGEKNAHWLCVRALRMSAAIAAQLLPELSPMPRQFLGDSPDLSLADVDWLLELDSQKSTRPLPETWDVTSDSIAARAAVLYQAKELVLLKSSWPSPFGNLRSLADLGYVDAHFPVCAKSIARIRFVNLRDPEFSEKVYFAS